MFMATIEAAYDSMDMGILDWHSVQYPVNLSFSILKLRNQVSSHYAFADMLLSVREYWMKSPQLWLVDFQQLESLVTPYSSFLVLVRNTRGIN